MVTIAKLLSLNSQNVFNVLYCQHPRPVHQSIVRVVYRGPWVPLNILQHNNNYCLLINYFDHIVQRSENRNIQT